MIQVGFFVCVPRPFLPRPEPFSLGDDMGRRAVHSRTRDGLPNRGISDTLMKQGCPCLGQASVWMNPRRHDRGVG